MPNSLKPFKLCILFKVKDEVEIEDLQPNTQYLVQVQSVANWGQKRLKSNKALFFFTTPSTGKSTETLPAIGMLKSSVFFSNLLIMQECLLKMAFR